MPLLLMWMLASVLAFYAMTAVYVMSQAMLGRVLGVKVEEVSIGFAISNRDAIRWQGKLWQWKIGWMPFGGYTKYRGLRDDEPPADETVAEKAFNPMQRAGDAPSLEDPGNGSFQNASLLVRLVLLVVGPLSQVALGLALLCAAPVMKSPQLQLTPVASGTIHPVAVSGLTFGEAPSSLRSQLDFVRDVALYLAPRYFFIESLQGCGGWIGFFATCGAVAKQSLVGWLTCFGCGAIINGWVNLLPIPVLNGGRLLFLLLEIAIRSPAPMKVETLLSLLGFLVVCVLFLRIVAADLFWLWNLVLNGL
ncbi:MAG: site-2 protease family protein [Pirellulaceae bacterium]